MKQKVSAIVNLHMDTAGLDSLIALLQRLRKQKGKPDMTWYEKKDHTRVFTQSGWDHPNVALLTSDLETKLVIWKIE
jgi:anti-anti-sigma regulatory factor